MLHIVFYLQHRFPFWCLTLVMSTESMNRTWLQDAYKICIRISYLEKIPDLSLIIFWDRSQFTLLAYTTSRKWIVLLSRYLSLWILSGNAVNLVQNEMLIPSGIKDGNSESGWNDMNRRFAFLRRCYMTMHFQKYEWCCSETPSTRKTRSCL